MRKDDENKGGMGANKANIQFLTLLAYQMLQVGSKNDHESYSRKQMQNRADAE